MARHEFLPFAYAMQAETVLAGIHSSENKHAFLHHLPFGTRFITLKHF
jgi:hypothetical protein